MADTQLLLKHKAEDGFFADGDPLAELARIASFDPQGESRPRQSNVRREPEFNLEDELLREFEQYEAPAEAEILGGVDDGRHDVVQALVEPVHAHIPEPTDLQSSETLIETAAAGEPAQVREVPELRAVPEPEFEAPVELPRPSSHPVFDLEDEILREFAAFDAKRATPPSQPAAVADIPSGPDLPAEPAFEAAPIVEAPVAPVAEQVIEDEAEWEEAASHDAYSGYGDDDLTAEAEVLPETASLHAVSDKDSALDAMEAEVDSVQWQAAEEPLFVEKDIPAEKVLEEPRDFQMESAVADSWDSETDVVEPTQQDDKFAAADIDIDAGIHALDAPAAIIHPDVGSSAVVDVRTFEPGHAAVPESATIAAPAAIIRRGNFGLDAVLADAERYPVKAIPARWPETIEPVEVEVPAADVAPPVEIAIPVAEVINTTVEPIVTEKVEPVAEPNVVPAVAEPFDDAAFELDLTEIELDMLEMEVETSVSPAIADDQIVASPSVLADVAKATVESKPAYVPERSFVPAPRVVEDYSSLPFDPSQISGDEDQIEALAEMDVPEVAVVEHEMPPPTQPDYDIDIDAEMAHIFARPAEVPARTTAPAASTAQAASASASPSTDLDEFERALEEDFRRSLSENRATSTPDRVALTPASYNGGRRESTASRRLLVLAASVAGLVLVGGAAVYAYWGDGAKILSTSSEPKVILADKDPVKIQPKDRGGQTVPNQDKAVYDRVSGDGKDVTKQERLVTSNEEPVDVVQKTLMPETLPMDDEDSANATDTSDTTDPRLLPDGQDKNITTTEKVVSGVSPRKVRTMVVRSDGTLVPRDELVAGDTDEPTPAEAAQERSLEITPAVTENVPDRLSANDAVAKQIEEASADTKSFVPSVATPTAVTDAKAADKQAVIEDQPAKAEDKPVVADDAKPADAAPVKQEEIAATPLTQTDDTAATDIKPHDQAALSDVANADVDETAPIRAVKTTKITANTPIPENRPVDQPVDIVGTVTDQGNVNKTQEVANADPVQPVENTQTMPTPSGAYVIQIASLPSEAEAQNSYSKLSAKFSSVIGGRSVDIKKAAIKNKGTYYRVRIPVGTRQEATDLCSRYKAAGGSCLVSK